MSASHSLVYWTIGKGLIGTFTRSMVRLKSYGKERVPREGGAVLAMNHFSYADPPAFGVMCPRRIVFVAKIELYGMPGFGELLRAHGALAVRRGENDRDALRLMREAVRNNELLGLFVEGTRQKSGVPGEAKPGAAMVAIQEGVPVVPAAIHGSQFFEWGHWTPISVAFGEPIRFDDYPRNSRGYRDASDVIDAEIKRLWDFLVRMHELGRPNAMPPRREHVPARTA
jgi:1-acyl-sn-glycerol-3-phosphate acyltransferase